MVAIMRTDEIGKQLNFEDDESSFKNEWNETSVANCAYIALHATDPDIRIEANALLKRWRQWKHRNVT